MHNYNIIRSIIHNDSRNKSKLLIITINHNNNNTSRNKLIGVIIHI
jgi:hypothetical protein